MKGVTELTKRKLLILYLIIKYHNYETFPNVEEEIKRDIKL